MKKLLFTCMTLATLIHAQAQTQRRCGSAEHYQQMLQQNPDFAQQRNFIENQTAQFQTLPDNEQKRVVITIPVVVHVLYNTATQNISDAQIQSQISILNADYRKLNADASLIPSAFAGVAADCEIQFCMAQQTPTGAATTGIERISTTKTAFDASLDNAKSSSTGGANAWDASKYLNIWVVPSIVDGTTTGILGYAQFPGGPAATDGVVIGYKYFGNTGTATAPYNKGRTATHEVGHWLNLYHIWGDDGTGCSGSDLVNDTPNQADENYGCPTFPTVSCSNGPNGDMFMNYMDYSDDACMYMFTAGQKTRISSLFAVGGSRYSLTTSPGCTPGGTVSCGTPSGLNSSNITATGATIGWTAVSGATSYNVQYKLSTATTWTTLTASVNSAAISGLTASSTYNVQVQANCNGTLSAYATAINFTTSASSTGTCTNNYESNNTRATATTIANNTNITSMIGTSTDNDYFKITTTSAAPKLKVTLTNLPKDYDLKLYNASGTLLASSLATGTTSETVKYNTATAGATYYAQVYGFSGAFSTTSCYTLLASTSASNFKEESTIEEIAKPAFNLYPNPVQDKFTVSFFEEGNKHVTINVYSAVGQKVAAQQMLTIEGENESSFDVHEMPKGMYLVELITDSERKVVKFTHQ